MKTRFSLTPAFPRAPSSGPKGCTRIICESENQFNFEMTLFTANCTSKSTITLIKTKHNKMWPGQSLIVAYYYSPS